ncbi:putative cytochrome p450 monooxygenase [Diaporthe ampelina]|uniref:Putative cytochrome p450 monooxygenase n=1 Tax=Diaporthe ampelina TaxID=1214573 RepID=A0A0G2FYQ5_9PEZI|nr:putative cytochrome p450 monooxygenase [Diaporthe ampelina]
MLCLGEFAARYKTNDAFKYRRHLKHDLMALTFLNNHVGPFVHRKGLELVRLLDMKIDLAQGRPFSIRHDYENVALDIVTHYEFGENMTLSAVRPQLELLSKRVHHRFATGPTDRDEPVELPEARLDPFLMAVDQAPAVLEKTTNSWVPKLSHWWWTHQSWYKNIFSHRGYVIPEQIAKAIRNYQRGKVNSALEHVIMREAAMAEKEGRSPQFGAQWLIDEAFGDLIASHHTNSGAMSWTSKYLTDYPEVQAMLRAHLHSELSAAAVEKRQPTYEEITKARLPYLEAVIAEMQRLTPFSMVREATCDTI